MRNQEFEKWCDEKEIHYKFYVPNIGILKEEVICQCKHIEQLVYKHHYYCYVGTTGFEICCEHLKEIDDYDKLISHALLNQ